MPETAAMVGVAALPAVLATGLRLDEAGRPVDPVLFVDLDAHATTGQVHAAAHALWATPGMRPVLIGVAHRAVEPHPVRTGLDELGEALTTTLTSTATCQWQVGVDDLEDAVAQLADSIVARPVTAMTLDRLLRVTATTSVADGLMAESMAYSALLAGAEFRGWLAARTRREPPLPTGPAVLLDRRGAELLITLNRPERHNAFDRWVRDGLVEAFDLVASDDAIERVTVTGAGRSLCSGGDLDEFGTALDVTVAHLIRLDRSVAARLHRVRDRVRVLLHGACIGAGIEIPSFAGRVAARPDTAIRLPELAMGLVPGAGGTVGITARIGRWRTAYLALSGRPIGPASAMQWGLVDELLDP
jgi:enoyl-CoA hydratase/carnithine racemase